jgi:hypothetical protein
MAGEESQPHSTEPLHGESSANRTEREILRTERSIFFKLAQALKLAEFMAILMVLATFFSAYATWRTAQLTRLVFAIADRPFIGVQQVSWEGIDTEHPAIVVNYRNFGSISALDALVSVHALVDGKAAKSNNGEMSAKEVGILSPTVPHFFRAFVSPDDYRAVTAGKSNLQVHIKIVYKGPGRDTQLCYFERMSYDSRTATFEASGGSDRCGSEIF